MLIVVPGKTTEYIAQPRFIHPNKGVRIPLPEFLILYVDFPLDEIKQNSPSLFVIDDRFQVFIQYFQAKTYWTSDLPPDGQITSQLPGEKLVEYPGILGGEGERLRVIHFREIFVEFLFKSCSVEYEPFLFKVNSYTGEILRGLNIHILVQAHFRKLGPERDVQA